MTAVGSRGHGHVDGAGAGAGSVDGNDRGRFVTINKEDHPLSADIFTDRVHPLESGMWLFIEREMFIGESAKRWRHLTKEARSKESVNYTKTLIEIFALFAQCLDPGVRSKGGKPASVISMGQVVSALNPEQWVGMFIHLRSQSEGPVSVAHTWQHMLSVNNLNLCRLFNPTFGNTGSDGGEEETEESVDEDGGGGGGGGGKKRKKTQNSKWKKNKLDFASRSRRKADQRYMYSDMTIEGWEQLCLFYMGKMPKGYNRDRVLAGNITDLKHELNPYKVFSLVRFMQRCKMAGSDPSYYSFDSYRDPDDRVKWRLPENGKHFYRVRRDQFRPGPTGIWSFFFPHVPRPHCNVSNDPQIQVFLARSGDDSVSRQVFNTHANDDAAANEASLAARMQQNIHKAKKDCCDGTPDGLFKFSKVAHKLRKNGLQEWFNVGWNPDSDVSDSVKAVREWFDAYLCSNGRDKVVHCELPSMSGNLSSFDDKMVSINLRLDTAYSMRNMQQELMVLILGNLQVPLKTKMHLHALLTGPPAIGKTYIAEVLEDVMIPRTVTKVQTTSAKANTNGGCASSNCTIVREECVTSILGVDDSMVKGKAKYSNTAEVSNFKSLLSSSVVNSERTVQDLDTGEFNKRFNVTEMNCQHVCCANTSIKDADPAICSRFYCIACSEKDCERWRNLRASTRNETPAFNKFKSLVRDYMRLQQALIFMIAGLINCGVLPKIDLQVPNCVFQMVMDEAAEQGMPGTTNYRNTERLQFACQSLVMLRAIYKLWESPLSPLKGQQWQYEHLLLVAPYLVGEVDDAVKALTLLQNQFESPLQRDVLDVMQKQYFKISMSHLHPDQDSKLIDADAIISSSSSIPNRNPVLPLRRQSTQTSIRDYQQQQQQRPHRPLHPDCPPECVDTDPQHTHFKPFTGTLDQNLYVSKSLDATRDHHQQQPERRVGRPTLEEQQQRQQQTVHSDERRDMRTDTGKLWELTRQVAGLFKRQVLQDDVFMILKNLRDTSIPGKYGSSNSNPALTFAGNAVLVHKNLFSKNEESRNKLLDIIKRVVRHRHSRERNLLLLSMQKYTGVMDMLHVPAGTPSDRLLEVPNYNFLDDSTCRSLGTLIIAQQRVSAGGGGGVGVGNDVFDPSMSEVFKDRPFYFASMDLDDAKCLANRVELGITDEYMQAFHLPPLSHREYEDSVSVAQEKDMKPDYPYFLKFIKMQRIENAFRTEANDLRYQSNYMIDQILAKDASLLSGGKSDGTFEDDSADGHYGGDDDDNDDGDAQEEEEEDTAQSLSLSSFLDMPPSFPDASQAKRDDHEEEEEEEKKTERNIAFTSIVISPIHIEEEEEKDDIKKKEKKCYDNDNYIVDTDSIEDDPDLETDVETDHTEDETEAETELESELEAE